MIYTHAIVSLLPGYKDGNYRHNLLLVMRHIDPNDSDSFENWKWYGMGGSDLTSNGNCVCSHDIRYVFHAEHKETTDIIELGSECINLFDPLFKKITHRAITLHKHPTNKYCPKCDKKVQGTVVAQYPNEQEIYHKSCYKKHKQELHDNEKLKCNWCEFEPARKDFKEHMKIHDAEIKLHNAKQRRLTFGKHNGKTLSEIYKSDRGYVSWLRQNAYNDSLMEDVKLLLGGE